MVSNGKLYLTWGAVHYLFKPSEKDEFVALEPRSEKWFRLWYGSDEFIHKSPRYCLFLKDCPPDELRQMPHVLQRIEAVRRYRANSTSIGTRLLAARPLKFHVEALPAERYLLIPEVSGEGRAYIPIGFMPPEVLCSNLAMLLPGATLYHFGILTSSLHMAWMRAVCGRLEMRYRYSIRIVYNNFPWPEPTTTQQSAIERAAQEVLTIRERFLTVPYDTLYNQDNMPDELGQAHMVLDRVVKSAYHIATEATETEIAQNLLVRHQEITDRLEAEGRN